MAGKYQVCPTCEGEGRRVLNGQAFTAEELEIAGPEFVEDMLAGVYDTICECCRGQRVVTESRLRAYEEELADFRLSMAENGMW